MKRRIQRLLCVIIVIGMSFFLIVNYYVQIKMLQSDMETLSRELFWHVDQILEENTLETETVKKEFEGLCLLRAKAAAYIVQHRPYIMEDLEEMKKVAELLQVDELHMFDTKGTIIAGSEPKYYGYNFNSGEQMQFFLPILEDRTLELCQPITPNTAEGKMMQYAAVWREDEQGIVQIGMEPARVLQATEKNQLSYIFAMFGANEEADLYAADLTTHEILGATREEDMGKTLEEIGINHVEEKFDQGGFHAIVNGEKSYCIFMQMNGVMVGRICTASNLYRGVNEGTLLLVVYLLVICAVMVWGISRYLDQNIVYGINEINRKLQNITRGDLGETVDVNTTPEFGELSGYINGMVESILNTTNKLEIALDMAEIPIGVYEYNKAMGRVLCTSKVPEILGLSEDEKSRLMGKHVLFEKKLAEIRKHPLHGEKNIFRLPGVPERYIRMESFTGVNSFSGILMEVTKNIKEKKQIEHDRDEDLLTGIHNRRAFYAQLDELFEQPESLKQAVLMMVDMDRLKQVNDCYGHESGDCYLKGMAEILRRGSAQDQVAARLGGDEFALLVYGCESMMELQKYICEMEEKQGEFQITLTGGEQIPVEFSMGCAFYPEDGATYRELMKAADRRMYEEKRKKKNLAE